MRHDERSRKQFAPRSRKIAQPLLRLASGGWRMNACLLAICVASQVYGDCANDRSAHRRLSSCPENTRLLSSLRRRGELLHRGRSREQPSQPRPKQLVVGVKTISKVSIEQEKDAVTRRVCLPGSRNMSERGWRCAESKARETASFPTRVGLLTERELGCASEEANVLRCPSPRHQVSKAKPNRI